jgi:hypothetical protein
VSNVSVATTPTASSAPAPVALSASAVSATIVDVVLKLSRREPPSNAYTIIGTTHV